MTELDLLKKALDVDTETSNSTRRWSAHWTETGAGSSRGFVEIEEGHQAIVQAEIDSVSGTGVWFDTKEFNLEMG